MQYISDDTARGGPPPRPGSDTMPMGISDEIPHDQKIIRKTHIRDNFQLIIEPLLQCILGLLILPLRQTAIALGKPLLAERFQVSCRIHPLRDRTVSRQNMLAEFQLQLTFVSDHRCIANRFRHMREQRGHLSPVLQVELVRIHFQTILVLNTLARADTDQHILHFSIRLLQIMDIIGRHQCDARLFSQLNQLRIHHLLLWNAVILQFQIEVLTEHRLIAQSSPLRFFITAVQQMLWHLTT